MKDTNRDTLNVMKRELRKRSESTVDEILRVLDAVRAEVLAKIGDLPTEELRDRALKLSKDARKRAEQRIRPRRRSRLPFVLVAVGIGVGVGYLLADRGRRERVRNSLDRVGQTARSRMGEIGVSGAVDGVMYRVREGGGAVQDSALKSQVEGALAGSESMPKGLHVTVEGRTVYLRGTVADPSAVDGVMEKVQSMPGVVAVVNLTTPSQVAAR